MEWSVVIESVGCQTNRCGFSQATDDDFDWWRRYGESETDFTGMLREKERNERWSKMIKDDQRWPSLRRLSDSPWDCMIQCGAAWWLFTLQDPQRVTLLAEPMVWWQSPFGGKGGGVLISTDFCTRRKLFVSSLQTATWSRMLLLRSIRATKHDLFHPSSNRRGISSFAWNSTIMHMVLVWGRSSKPTHVMKCNFIFFGPFDCLIDGLMDYSFGITRRSNSWDSQSIDWLIHRLIDWLIDWPIDWLIDWLFEGLIDWLIDLSFDWLIDWLIDCSRVWLIDWLFFSSSVSTRSWHCPAGSPCVPESASTIFSLHGDQGDRWQLRQTRFSSIGLSTKYHTVRNFSCIVERSLNGYRFSPTFS